MRCEDSRLLQLLNAEDESSAICRGTSAHLETCESCRQRLEALAADGPWWQELTQSLSDDQWSAQPSGVLGSNLERSSDQFITGESIIVALEPSLHEELPAACDVILLDFLEPPRHPELLGHLGRYNFERVIGSGGMGIVLKAFDTELHRYVAVKVLAPHLAGSGAARLRFAREAQAAAAIAHHNVMPIHDVQTEHKMPYIVMPLVTGRSLQAWVDHRGPLTVEESLRVLQQSAAALAAAHNQGIVHRDVKPANILIEEGGRVLLSDFGLARAVDDAAMTRTGFAAGTPHYMSPEQATGDRVDYRSDLYSLGSVFYFMLTAASPYTKGGPMAILRAICHDSHLPVDQRRDGLSEEVVALSNSLLSKIPEQRPHDANAVRDICEHLIRQRRFHHEPLATDSSQRAAVAPRWTVGATAMLVVACVALISLGGWAIQHAISDKDHADVGRSVATEADASNKGESASGGTRLSSRPLPSAPSGAAPASLQQWLTWEQDDSLLETLGAADQLWLQWREGSSDWDSLHDRAVLPSTPLLQEIRGESLEYEPPVGNPLPIGNPLPMLDDFSQASERSSWIETLHQTQAIAAALKMTLDDEDVWSAPDHIPLESQR